MATASRPRFAFLRPRREGAAQGPAIHGTARLGLKTKELVKRLGPTDIAVVDHTNIDRIAAEELIATGVRAVVNASDSSNGRYPNSGPLLLVRAGVAILDAPRSPLFEVLRDGDPLTISGDRLMRGGELIVKGRLLEADRLAAELEVQRLEINRALAAFAENTVAHVRDEGDLLMGGVDYPVTRTTFRDRHVLIVVRGTRYRRDLQALRAYIRDMRPLLVGVDGGAEALLESGLRPDVILGDMDSAGDEALACGAELIVHAYPDGRAPGRERLDRLGLSYTTVPSAGTSQDVAMLLAFEKGAALIVSVGAHFNLIEFLDKDRGGMSSTFLTRLRIGETLVDAKGVSRLYKPGLGFGPMVLFLLAFAVLLVIVIITSPVLEDVVSLTWLKIKIWLGI